VNRQEQLKNKGSQVFFGLRKDPKTGRKLSTKWTKTNELSIEEGMRAESLTVKGKETGN